MLEYYDADVTIRVTKNKTRRIPARKLLIDRQTPVGEDADLYEAKPYGGLKYIPWSIVIEKHRPPLGKSE